MKTIDLESETFVVQDIKFPVDLVASNSLKGTWEILEWADDNKFILTKYTTEKGIEYLLINRDKPLESVNVTTTLKDIPFTEVSLRNQKSDLLFVYNEKLKTLSKVRADGTNLVLYAENVEAYTSFGEDVLYVSNMPEDKTKALAKLKRGNEEFPLRELQRSEEYLLDLSKLGGAFVAGVTSKEEDRTFVYYDPIKSFEQDNAPKYPVLSAVLRIADPEELRISQNSSAITVRGGQRFATH
jgi:hypothetical protein